MRHCDCGIQTSWTVTQPVQFSRSVGTNHSNEEGESHLHNKEQVKTQWHLNTLLTRPPGSIMKWMWILVQVFSYEYCMPLLDVLYPLAAELAAPQPVLPPQAGVQGRAVPALRPRLLPLLLLHREAASQVRSAGG